MENKYIANIVLCQKIDDMGRMVNTFNNIEVENEEAITFDMGVYVSCDIKETREELFMFTLVYEEEDGNCKYHPLGTVTKDITTLGKCVDYIQLQNYTVSLVGDGLYTLEMRLCNEHKDINSMSDGEVLDMLIKGKLITSYSFNVTTIKK